MLTSNYLTIPGPSFSKATLLAVKALTNTPLRLKLPV